MAEKGSVDGTCEKQTDNVVLAVQWDRCNSVVLSWILNSISEDLYSGQFFSATASVVWTELKETYDKVDGSIVFKLHHKINSMKQNGYSLSEYYHKLNTLWKQYDEMVILPACTCVVAPEFQNHNKTLKLMQFLGLDDSYMSIRSNLLLMDPLPDVKSAFAILSREESHRGVSRVGTSKTQNSAFVHPSTPSSSTSAPSPLSLSNEQMMKLLSILNEKSSPISESVTNMSGFENQKHLGDW
ncbi:uncharacterized protein [Rutidosis leptorrhynchoides]|uniref:uncharacterized protein n=1 Tax=Rutidosis leptorrhynchoides TaxID=125765 RepID=UPI003A9A5C7D